MEESNPWPAPSAPPPRNPVLELLDKYSGLLHQRYPDLEGRVVVTHREESPKHEISLYVLNPKLRGYNTRLLSVKQWVDRPFPVSLQMHYKTYSAPEFKKIADATELANLLNHEIGTPGTQNILNSILALGNTMEDFGKSSAG